MASSNAAPKDAKKPKPMPKKQLAHFEKRLLEERKRVIKELGHHGDTFGPNGEADGDTSAYSFHMADQGTDAYEQEFTLSLVENNRTLLKDINDAMAKIQNGSFGLCEGTGKPITRPRLEAIPWVRYSLEFAQAREKKQGMFRR